MPCTIARGTRTGTRLASRSLTFPGLFLAGFGRVGRAVVDLRVGRPGPVFEFLVSTMLLVLTNLCSAYHIQLGLSSRREPRCLWG
jgi:hypothetical protein